MPSNEIDRKGSSTATPLLGSAQLPHELYLVSEAQWIFTEDDLLLTPSVVAGLSANQERENRAKGVNFILQVGIMLKLPQITLASASVFLHRFFMRYPMIEDKVHGRPFHHYYSVAATCLFLATKVEENCRKMKELVVACVRVAQKNPNKVVDEQDKEFWRWRDTILQLEDLLLEALCFDLSLEPPYKALFEFLKNFNEGENKPLRNTAWAFLNDSCLTPLCLLWPSRTIAASALYAAARHCGVRFLDDKDGKPWWEVVGVSLKSIQKACNFMASIYENAPLKGGVEESIYQRTPEDGDETLAKTRKLRSEGDTELNSQNTERRDSTVSAAGSNVSRKRGRNDEGGVKETAGLDTQRRGGDKLHNGESEENRGNEKRRRLVDEKDLITPSDRLNGAGTGSPVDGSEEGEVEDE